MLLTRKEANAANSHSLNCVSEKGMRMFSIFHKLEECFCFVFKGCCKYWWRKQTGWLLSSFNVIFTLLALHKCKSLEKRCLTLGFNNLSYVLKTSGGCRQTLALVVLFHLCRILIHLSQKLSEHIACIMMYS